jgi:hypothetical protein
MYCTATAEVYVSITEDPVGWAKSFSEATQEQRKAIYKQSVEDVARSKTGGMWDTLVNLVTRDKHLTANELLTRLNDNLHRVPNEYREAVSFVTVMKALDSLTDKERVKNNSQKVETMAKVFGVPLAMAKKLYLKQLIKSNSALAKYPNVVQAADSFIAVEKANILDVPKTYEPTQGTKLVNTELVHAGQKLPEVAPIPVPEVAIKPENLPDVQSKQGSESKQHEPVEEKQEPKREQPKEQVPTAKPTDSRQIDRLSLELNSKSALVRELQEKIIELEKQPKEFRPHLVEEGRKNSKENELEAQVKALRDEISGKDSSMAQLARERSAEKSDLDARLQATTAELTQSQRDLGVKDAENNTLVDQLNQRGVEIRGLTAEKSDLDARLRTMTAELTQSQRDLGVKDAENNTLVDQLNRKDADITRLTAEKSDLDARLRITKAKLTQSQQDLINQQTQNKTLQQEITGVKSQNKDLQLQASQLSVPNERTEFLATVNKILGNKEYLDVMSYEIPPELPAPPMQPLLDLSHVLTLIYKKCVMIYREGIQIRTSTGEHTIRCYEDLIDFNRRTCGSISGHTQIMKELKRSFICAQGMLDVPQGKTVETVLQEVRHNLGAQLTSQQKLLKSSLEFFMEKFNNYNQLVTDIRELTEGVNNCFGIWPFGKSSEKSGLAVLKIFQLMKSCNVSFEKFIVLFIVLLEGQEWNEKNVLNALRQVKMKFYVLNALELAKGVASPAVGFWKSQPRISQKQLISMGNILKGLTSEDVELTDIEWFTGCQYFIDPCPAKEKIEVSLEKAELLFQKVYKGPLMDEKCFLQMLLSCKLKDLLQ